MPPVQPIIKQLPTPIHGIVRSIARSEPDPLSLIDGVNCLPYGPWDGLKRLTSRPSLSFFSILSTSTAVNGLQPFGYIAQPGSDIPGVPYTLQFSTTGHASTIAGGIGVSGNGDASIYVNNPRNQNYHAKMALTWVSSGTYGGDVFITGPWWTMNLEMGPISLTFYGMAGAGDGSTVIHTAIWYPNAVPVGLSTYSTSTFPSTAVTGSLPLSMNISVSVKYNPQNFLETGTATVNGMPVGTWAYQVITPSISSIALNFTNPVPYQGFPASYLTVT